MPREASNLSEVRFGDVAVLKQFSVLHRNFDRFLPIFVFAALSLSFLVFFIMELLGKLL
jgi:hypothetical protein